LIALIVAVNVLQFIVKALKAVGSADDSFQKQLIWGRNLVG
jgi:hypothetical protein